MKCECRKNTRAARKLVSDVSRQFGLDPKHVAGMVRRLSGLQSFSEIDAAGLRALERRLPEWARGQADEARRQTELKL
jgi:hypothetical protein